tara:strand:+ start:678 stop:1046 length:369 start_codon:yes stop_codon:yes gene_type:complete
MPYEEVVDKLGPSNIGKLEDFDIGRWGSTAVDFYKDGRVHKIEGASLEIDGEVLIRLGDSRDKVLEHFGLPPIPEEDFMSYPYGVTFQIKEDTVTRITIIDEHIPTELLERPLVVPEQEVRP